MDKLIDPDCRSGKHSSCVGGTCECACHAMPETDRAIFDGMIAVYGKRH